MPQIEGTGPSHSQLGFAPSLNSNPLQAPQQHVYDDSRTLYSTNNSRFDGHSAYLPAESISIEDLWQHLSNAAPDPQHSALSLPFNGELVHAAEGKRIISAADLMTGNSGISGGFNVNYNFQG